MRTVPWTTRVLAPAAMVGFALSAGCGAPKANLRRPRQPKLNYPAAFRPERPAPARLRASSGGRSALVAAVMGANASLKSAQAHHSQAKAVGKSAGPWPNPEVSYQIAPISALRSDSRFGQNIGLAQRLPWPGKRGSEKQVAEAKAKVVEMDLRKLQLKLCLQANLALDGLWGALEEQRINLQAQALAKDAEKAEAAAVPHGGGSLLTPLRYREKSLELEIINRGLAARQAAYRAQLRALTHGAFQHQKPAPLAGLGQLPPLALWQRHGRDHRPELAKQDWLVAQADAQLNREKREHYPDLRVFANYNSMWPHFPHQVMVGVGAQIPLQINRYRAQEAAQQAAKERAKLARLGAGDALSAEVQTHYHRVQELMAIRKLYQQRFRPLLETQTKVAAAEALRSPMARLAWVRTRFRQLELKAREVRNLVAIHQAYSELEAAAGLIPGQQRRPEVKP